MSDPSTWTTHSQERLDAETGGRITVTITATANGRTYPLGEVYVEPGGAETQMAVGLRAIADEFETRLPDGMRWMPDDGPPT